MADIFISYAHSEQRTARRLAVALEKLGATVWIDHQISGGSTFSDVIETELGAARKVVVLWSKESIRSRWVRDEAAAALEQNKLVPVLLDGSNPPMGFRQVQAIDLQPWCRNSHLRLPRAMIEALALGAGTDEPLQLDTPRAWRRRPVVFGGFVAAVSALVAVLYVALGDGRDILGISPASEERVPVLVRAFAASGSSATESALAGGITDELIVRLRRIPGLQVATAHADGTAPSEAFERAIVVNGNIRSSEDQLKVTVRLAGADGQILWSDTFGRRMSDMFEVQEAIAAAIAETLSVSLDVGANSADSGGTNNPEAYAAYMQGFAHSIDPDPAIAQRYYERAVTLDPNFVKGWFGLAALAEPGRVVLIEDANRLLQQRDGYSAKALAANPNHWLGQNSRGGYELARRNLPAAERHFARSATLDRGDDPQLRTYLANWAMIAGRVKKADAIRRSNEVIDPIHRYDPWRIYDFVMLKRYREAIDLYSRLERSGSTALAGFARWAFFAHLYAGGEAEAVRFASEGGPALEAQLAEFNAARIVPAMSDAELRRSVADMGSSAISNRALYVAYLGHPALALKLMQMAMEKPGGTALLTFWHPAMAEARKTSEFEQLVAELGFVEMWRESGDWGDFCKPAGNGRVTCT